MTSHHIPALPHRSFLAVPNYQFRSCRRIGRIGQVTPIDVLPDEILLEIFDFALLVGEYLFETRVTEYREMAKAGTRL